MMSVVILQAQTTDVKREFERVEAYRPQQTDVVDIKARIPDHSIYQKKTDTAINPVYYRFHNILRETSKILLNKWLKESK